VSNVPVDDPDLPPDDDDDEEVHQHEDDGESYTDENA
jgi:hypothetical protein